MRSAVRLLLAGLLGMVAAVIGGVVLAPAAQAYDEDAIVQLVNEARWSDGSAGLIRNPDMDAVALRWAEQMAANGALSHNPDYASQIPGGWTSAAENVAQGYGSAGPVMDGWMNSSGHRANILGPHTDIGVALIESGGTTWAVQVFAGYPGHAGPSAPQAEPEPVAEPEPAPPVAAPVDTPTPTPTPTATPTPTPTRTSAAAVPASPTMSTADPRTASAEAADAELAANRSGFALPLGVLAGLVVLAAGSVLLDVVIVPRRRRRAH